MEFFRTIWPSWADIERSRIHPTRRAMWEQRALGVCLLVGVIAFYGMAAVNLARLLL